MPQETEVVSQARETETEKQYAIVLHLLFAIFHQNPRIELDVARLHSALGYALFLLPLYKMKSGIYRAPMTISFPFLRDSMKLALEDNVIECPGSTPPFVFSDDAHFKMQSIFGNMAKRGITTDDINRAFPAFHLAAISYRENINLRASLNELKLRV